MKFFTETSKYLHPSFNFIDLLNKFHYGKIYKSPLQLGYWAILNPSGIQNHAPQLCWLNNRRLACVWMSGGQEGNSSMSIVISTLNSRSSKWTKPKIISQNKKQSEQNPCLFVLEDKCIQLIHTSQNSRNINDRNWDEKNTPYSMQWTAKIISQRKNPSRANWEKMFELYSSNAFCRHPPYCRNDGFWLLPIYKSLEEGGAFGNDYSQVILLNRDGNFVDGPIDIPSSKGRVHGSIVQSKDGTKLLQFFRSRLADRIYRSIGSSNGETWSAPEPIDLPNNNSSIQSLRLSSGRLLMVFNRFSYQDIDEQEWGEANWPRTRWPLSLAISEDDGDTWPWIRDIDSGEGFCGEANWHLNNHLAYPSILEGNHGEIHLAYSWSGRLAIKYVCLREEEIMGEWWL